MNFNFTAFEVHWASDDDFYQINLFGFTNLDYQGSLFYIECNDIGEWRFDLLYTNLCRQVLRNLIGR